MRRKIIIIEDDKFILDALEIGLNGKNIEILTANNGFDGLKMVQDEKPDLVLLDLILPEMHGFKVLENLKNNGATKNIPVIIITNLGQEEEKKRGMELGAISYFVKANISLEDFIKEVLKVLKI